MTVRLDCRCLLAAQQTVSWIVLATTVACTSATSSDDQPANTLLIELPDGKLQGQMDGEARLFLKIPFAKPPLGELRWRAPLPNDPWTGVRYDSEFSEGCPQLADQGAPASNNEDCLYLNVWSPEPPPRDAPVMVWIHGGGNFSGAAGIPIPTTQELWYDGEVFASRQGVVLVTIHYRLGPLGFFAHPALAEEGEPVGNQGLHDQRLALEWVRDNIAAFGGDPGNVTIFGESAGAADVCYHMASPGSGGLFHRAISQSGGCTIRSVGPEATLTETGAQMVAYAEAVGCPAGPEQLTCLRSAPVEDLLNNANQPAPGAGEIRQSPWSFAAVLDGPGGFLPDALRALFDRGEIAQVPYLLGSNHDEGTTFVVRAPSLTSEAEYLADLTARYGDRASEVAAMYPPSDFDGDFNAARARVIGDSGVVCGTHDTARRAAAAGLKVYMYDFNVWWSIVPSLLRAGHAAEISHVFGTPYLPQPDPDSEAVAGAMNAYWARFARDGNPNGSSAPAVWPEFRPDDDKRLELHPEWAVLENFRARECEFWRRYYGAE
jgi:para-nitrobenzyl esterase